MPLTSKGNEIMSAMKKQYGAEKGERVFYASKNAGKISGVDRADMDAAEFDALRDLFDEFMQEEAQEPEHKKDASAASSKFLAEAKRTWNSKIYARCLEIYNSKGETEAANYLQQFTTKKIPEATREPPKMRDDSARPVDTRYLAVQADRSGRLDAAVRVMDSITAHCDADKT